jgi:hypothetical protein
MSLFRFRALITVDPPDGTAPVHGYPSGTRALMVHARRIGQPARDKFFSAMMTWDNDGQLRPGDQAVVTITVADEQAPAYLAAGQPFTLWGAATGRGVITRKVFTTAGPS